MSEEEKQPVRDPAGEGAEPPTEALQPRPAKKARPAKPEVESKPPDPGIVALESLLKSKLEEAVQESIIDRGMLTLVIDPARTLEVCRKLKDDPELDFNYLACLSSVDRKEHLDLAYNLRSLRLKHEFCLRVRLPRSDPRVASVTSVWKGANWHEREAYDLMGVLFEGHPDLRRILLPEDWEGYPLRKDYEYHPVDVPDHQGPPDHLLLQIEDSK